MSVSCGPAESVEDRLARLPNVLRAYARELDIFNYPLDRHLPEILRFLADQIEANKI